MIGKIPEIIKTWNLERRSPLQQLSFPSGASEENGHCENIVFFPPFSFSLFFQNLPPTFPTMQRVQWQLCQNWGVSC